MRIRPAKNMRKPVRKIGGLFSKASFPREKMLDQAAYMKIASATNIEIF
jgi:hypothetical protein